MERRRLTHEQAARLRASTGQALRWANAICRRFDQLGIPLDDELYAAARQAQDAIHRLSVAAHYASCESGVAQGGYNGGR